MTRIASIADVHVGNHQRFGGTYDAGINHRGRLVIGALARAVVWCGEPANGITALVVNGDLIDSTSVRPQIIGATAAVLAGSAVPVYLVMGNHDQNSVAMNDNALYPFKALANVHVIETPTVVPFSDLDVVLIPFQPGQADSWFEKTVAKVARKRKKGKRRILTTHLGIRDKNTPPWLREAADSIDIDLLSRVCSERGIEAVYAGNWHAHGEWNLEVGADKIPVVIVQNGALVPTGFDNEGIDGYGLVSVHDTNATNFLEYKHFPGPRFVKNKWNDYSKQAWPALSPEDLENDIYFEITAEHDDMGAALDALNAAIEALSAVAGEVIQPKKAVEAEVRAATEKATSAATLDETTDEYVAGMKLEEGVERKAVLQEVRTRLKL